MDLTTFSIDYLKTLRRPPEYLSDLRACAAEADDTRFVIDRDGECYKALWKKYRPRPAKAARVKGPSQVTDWSVRGPAMWRELHGRPREASGPPDPAAELKWLKQFSRRLPCGACISHWNSMMQRTPPDFTSRLAYFDWTHARHEEVNAKLSKPLLPLADARRMYGYPP